MKREREREKKEVQVSMYYHLKKDRRRIISCMNPFLFVKMTRYFFRRDDHFFIEYELLFRRSLTSPRFAERSH